MMGLWWGLMAKGSTHTRARGHGWGRRRGRGVRDYPHTLHFARTHRSRVASPRAPRFFLEKFSQRNEEYSRMFWNIQVWSVQINRIIIRFIDNYHLIIIEEVVNNRLKGGSTSWGISHVYRDFGCINTELKLSFKHTRNLIISISLSISAVPSSFLLSRFSALFLLGSWVSLSVIRTLYCIKSRALRSEAHNDKEWAYKTFKDRFLPCSLLVTSFIKS